LIILAVGLLLWIGFFVPVMIWDGTEVKPVTIRVIQGPERSPLEGATMILMQDGLADAHTKLGESERKSAMAYLKASPMAGTTSSDGTVTLHGTFPAGGESSLLIRRGTFRITGTLWLVRKDRVIDSRKLADLIPNGERSLRDELPPVEVVVP
jgi:hypothetical protein